VVTVLDESPVYDPAAGYAELTVRLRDGRSLTTRVDEPRGGPDSPLSWEELAGKFRDCAAGVLDPEDAESAIRAVGSLEQQRSLHGLLALLSGRVRAGAAGA
jgi:2-methylcitrate dehydratase PrpD